MIYRTLHGGRVLILNERDFSIDTYIRQEDGSIDRQVPILKIDQPDERYSCLFISTLRKGFPLITLQMLTLCKYMNTMLCFATSFVFAFMWNWIILETRNNNPKPIQKDISRYPFRIMNDFPTSNYTLLSPEEQDIRWKKYQVYYQDYQAKLTETGKEYYVIYTTTYSGLANKLNGLISSLLVAMVTDRGFLRMNVC